MNKQKVNKNLLQDSDVFEIQVADKIIRVIRVSHATRQESRYINNNPITGTYCRNYLRDYRCDELVVKRMLAEQVRNDQDKRIIPQTSISIQETGIVDSGASFEILIPKGSFILIYFYPRSAECVTERKIIFILPVFKILQGSKIFRYYTWLQPALFMITLRE